ncbi:unnamed protein product [Danaus chrysippus]|uniref:(African queen) hypothetical protein n=1 Tax=Danaus chrysippus TaxID=151541 RepID=A0A8J2QQV5_9NEOP|nr:unnamed protein product [Danaus chrysippus]
MLEKKLWPALIAENDEESVQVQTLTANIAEIANGIGRDGFEQIESSDIQELLESQDEDLTETDLEEMLNSQPIEEEASTSTENVTFTLKNLSEVGQVLILPIGFDDVHYAGFCNYYLMYGIIFRNREEDERMSVAASKASTKIKKLKKGKWKWRVKKNVGFAVWKDTKQVNVVSTAFHPKQKRNCNKTQKDGSKKSIRCPLLIPEYTKRMGGGDHFDQLRPHYAVGRRSRKWWTRIFYFFIDVAITNAYLIYKTNIRVHSVMNQKEFRIALSRKLVDNQTFRKRSFQTMPKHITKKKKRVEESDERQKRLWGTNEAKRT